MKTKLTVPEKIATLAGITIGGIILSSLIGKQLIPQLLLTCFIIYLISGDRPGIVFSFLRTWKRDAL